MPNLTPDQQTYGELIVLCGPPRSGTTWLNRELCNSPMSFPFLPECSFVTKQVELYNHTLHYSDRQRFQAYFANQDNLISYYKENIARLIDQTAILNKKPGAKTLIIKDPLLCLYLNDIKYLFPPHKLVVLVRDPRDVLASMKIVTAKKKQKWNVNDATEELFNYYSQIGSHNERAGKDSIFVRYEDIVNGKISNLQIFLQQPYNSADFPQPDVLSIRESLDQSDPFFSELYLQPTTSKKIGSYVKILSWNEINFAEYAFSDIMQYWDYLKVSSGVSVMNKTKRWFRYLCS